MSMQFVIIIVSAVQRCVDAGFNAMARTPPMGWRTWNQLGCLVSQVDVEAAMRGLVDTSRAVWNHSKPTSLHDLGYTDVGLDDCWQELLEPSCHYPNTPLPAVRACTDPNTTFPRNLDGVQCEGLAGPLPGVASSDSCARACCSDAACEVWQYCASGLCGGSAAPAESCYTGKLMSCHATADWISRGIAEPPHHFHDSNGRPVVNTTRFPDFIAMTNLAHALGLTAGWYGNNCFCHEETCGAECVQGDVDALVDYGFDNVKYDGCGPEHNMTMWAAMYAGTIKGLNMTIENCNNDNHLIPKRGDDLTKVPFHFYRSSTDIRPTYGSVVANWQTVVHPGDRATGPSVWAYPDMLEVGVTTQILTGQKVPSSPREHLGETVILQPGSPAYEALAHAAPLPPVLSVVESRAHFSMWCISSSPLTLALDFRDSETVDSVWDIIANPEAIAINQAWAGDSGGVLHESNETVTLLHCNWIWAGDSNCTVPVEQQVYKPLPNGAVAVLVANHGSVPLITGIDIRNISGLSCAPGPCHVREVNAHQTIGPFTNVVPVVNLQPHDVAFALIW